MSISILKRSLAIVDEDETKKKPKKKVQNQQKRPNIFDFDDKVSFFLRILSIRSPKLELNSTHHPSACDQKENYRRSEKRNSRKVQQSQQKCRETVKIEQNKRGSNSSTEGKFSPYSSINSLINSLSYSSSKEQEPVNMSWKPTSLKRNHPPTKNQCSQMKISPNSKRNLWQKARAQDQVRKVFSMDFRRDLNLSFDQVLH